MQSMVYFPYSNNSLLDKGNYALGCEIYYSNIYMFNQERTTIIDFEVFSNCISLKYGLFQGLNLEFYFRWFAIFGGFMDSAIENFHTTFHMPDNNRAEFPRNSVLYRYKDYFSHNNRKTVSSPFILAVLKNIYTGNNFSFKTRISIGFPLSNIPGLSSGKPFLSAGLIFNFKKKWFSLDFSNYIALSKRPSWLDEEQLRKQVLFTRLEVNIFRFIGGFIIRSSVFKEGDIAHHAYQAYIGYRIAKHLDFIILEDFKPFDTTPDVSFNLRIKIF